METEKNTWKYGQNKKKGCDSVARARVEGFDDLQKVLRGLMEPEGMAIKAVNEAAPLLEKSLRKNVKAAANRTRKNGKPYSTGALEKSIIATPAKKNQYGVFSVVKPNGVDERGMSNSYKLNILEHGTHSFKNNQEPRPVLQKSVNEVRQECEQKMQEAINDAVNKLW